MPIEQVLIAEKHQYPFHKANSFPCENKIFLVKIDDDYQNDTEYNILKEKLNLRKQLQHHNLISLSHSLQEPGRVHQYFEYVHLQMNQIWVQSIGQDFFEKIRKDMIELAQYLHKKRIIFKFNPKNVGVSQQMGAKYFLENFQIQQTDDGVSFQLVINEINKYFEKLLIKEKQNEPKFEQKLHVQAKNQQQMPLTYRELEKKLEDRRKKSLEALQKLKRSGC